MSATPTLAALSQQLPKTQAEWQQVINQLQSWKTQLTAAKWQAPTLLNGWVNYGSGFNPAGYYIDVTSRVWLRGLLKSGTANTAAFQLPVIPSYRQLLVGLGYFSSEGAYRIDVDTSGNVLLGVDSSGVATFASLDGLSFSLFP